MSTKAGSPEKLRQELMESFTVFEANFRKQYPLTWISTLIGPMVVSVLILVTLGFVHGPEYPLKIVWHVFMTFFVFGRFIILTGMEAAGELPVAEGAKALLNKAYEVTMNPAELFGLVTYMDFMVALFVTFHMGVLFRLPYVGEKIAALVWDGKFIMESQPWIIDDRQHRWFDLWPLAGYGAAADVEWRVAGQHLRERADVRLRQTD